MACFRNCQLVAEEDQENMRVDRLNCRVLTDWFSFSPSLRHDHTKRNCDHNHNHRRYRRVHEQFSNRLRISYATHARQAVSMRLGDAVRDLFPEGRQRQDG